MGTESRTIRVGIVGAGRGVSFLRSARLCGLKVVAVCDAGIKAPTRVWLRSLLTDLGITLYEDYERFLEHDLDAVVLANYFHQHAPFAIKALAAGKHVLSETAACHTLAEGVALARAVERSGRIYMFAENYVYGQLALEMHRLFQAGVAGLFQYGEGEYVHPARGGVADSLQGTPSYDHWRAWFPATYYCTHAMAPIMHITGTRPVRVNGFVVPRSLAEPDALRFSISRSDRAGLIICRMDNGAVVKLLQGGLQGGFTRFRIHGSRALLDTTHDSRLVIKQEPWATPDGRGRAEFITPEFREDAELARQAGHGGSDFFVVRHFADAIRRNEPPFLDVYRGLDMSLIGILAYRSALNDSAPEPVPDFRDESVRRRYENDHWSPDPARREPGQPWPSLEGDVQITAEARRFAELTWGEIRKRLLLQDWKEYNTRFEAVREHSGAEKRRQVQANLRRMRAELADDGRPGSESGKEHGREG